MDWLTAALSPRSVADLETQLGTWGSLAFLVLFALEMLRLALKKRLTLKIVGDSVASVITFGLFLALTYGLLAASYLSIFYWAYLNFAFTEIAVTPFSVALLVVLCDFAYYWEHRFTHRVGMAWATHSVHHSSPYFNISVAYRFGPMDGVWPLLFHLPLVVAGFDPIVVFACEAFVQLYQTILHTEVIGRLPRPIEAIFNTPSHHRVHHGTNRPYIDKNYGGVFIVWDRLFGTFAEEQESVSYGITEPIDSNNPLTVWLHGFGRLARRSFASTTYADAPALVDRSTGVAAGRSTRRTPGLAGPAIHDGAGGDLDGQHARHGGGRPWKGRRPVRGRCPDAHGRTAGAVGQHRGGLLRALPSQRHGANLRPLRRRRAVPLPHGLRPLVRNHGIQLSRQRARALFRSI
ncbi:MAG: sterol desaturase family protein [Pseudomonadota bacterium]